MSMEENTMKNNGKSFEEIFKEGFKAGMRTGRERDKVETYINCIKNGMEPQMARKLTEISKQLEYDAITEMKVLRKDC